jgi:hypothetical protein
MLAAEEVSPYTPLVLPPYDKHPPGWEPTWWPINAAQQAAINCRAELLLMGGQSGGGKLLGVDEPIPTTRGFVRNGDIQTGDCVFGEDGKPYPVVVAHPVVEDEAFLVSFDDGTSVLAHAGHLWHTFTFRDRQRVHSGSDRFRERRKERRPAQENPARPWLSARNRTLGQQYIPAPVLGSVKTTDEIRRTLLETNCKRANHSIILPRPIEMPVSWLPLDPYLLGVWLGDGTTTAGSLTISTRDALELKRNLATGGAHFSPRKDPITYGVRGLQSALRSMGLLGNKHIPHEYLWACAEQRLALLQGLMDTDGCANKDGQCEFTNMNEALSRGVYCLAASLGLKPFWAEGRATLRGKDCGTKYIVKWTGLVPCFRLKRKLRRLPKKIRLTQTWRYIVSVEPAGRREMRCLTVANPSGLYLFGLNFNVTHNTSFLAADAMQEYRNPYLRSLVLRETLVEMSEMADQMQRLYEPLGAQWRKPNKFEAHAWVFPNGGYITPGYMRHDKDLSRYQGNPKSHIGVDESGKHPESRIRKLLGWLAAPIRHNLFVRARFCSNPGDVGHGWQMSVFLRNKCPRHFPADRADDRPQETSVYPGRVYFGARWPSDDGPVVKTTAFIPARLIDNPFYDRVKLESLMLQTAAIREQLLYGCWCNAEGLYFPFLRPEYLVPFQTVPDEWWWGHFIGIDYGYGNSAAAAGMYAINPNGRVFKVRERIERKMGSKDFVLNICKRGFPAVDSPRQAAHGSWLGKLRPRDPEPPRMLFALTDPANDQHHGTGKSNYEIMSDVFAAHGVATMLGAHDPMGNAQNLYNGLSNRALTITDACPYTFGTLTSRVVDDRKAVKKEKGNPQDDCYDETSYSWNTHLTESVKPARQALQEELDQMRKDGMDETSLARYGWQREQAIRQEEVKASRGISLSGRRIGRKVTKR